MYSFPWKKGKNWHKMRESKQFGGNYVLVWKCTSGENYIGNYLFVLCYLIKKSTDCKLLECNSVLNCIVYKKKLAEEMPNKIWQAESINQTRFAFKMRLKKPILYISSLFLLCLVLIYFKSYIGTNSTGATTKPNAIQLSSSNS